jgi:SPP1 family predicted phage head-tail adaptor
MDLRHIVTIDEPVTSQDDTGEEIVQWQPYGKTFAAIEPLRGRELTILGGIQAASDTRIKLRWAPAFKRITPKWRIRFQDTVYNIESIINVDTRYREMEVMCSSGVNDG